MARDNGPAPVTALQKLTDVLAQCPSAPDGPEDTATLAALEQLRVLREQLDAWEPQLIAAARAAGVSWAQLASALGLASRQAAERRYLRLAPNAAEPGLNREQRVQAARDQRAGDRAVTVWAHENSADLRRLAGQVAALDGLTPGAQQASVDAVHDALADDDSTALLAPLAAAGHQLGGDHPRLADRISEVTARTDEARQAGHDRNRP
ncbi:hypothetical protein ACIA49_32700 [Kribbella sp. NPDC051587]|uniref:hypothetical protein n=1 Tax=Kribbella sp. NPDC051587 TaxID=3364119 RepID=UPI0037BB2283